MLRIFSFYLVPNYVNAFSLAFYGRVLTNDQFSWDHAIFLLILQIMTLCAIYEMLRPMPKMTEPRTLSRTQFATFDITDLSLWLIVRFRISCWDCLEWVVYLKNVQLYETNGSCLPHVVLFDLPLLCVFESLFACNAFHETCHIRIKSRSEGLVTNHTFHHSVQIPFWLCQHIEIPNSLGVQLFVLENFDKFLNKV